jgi:hypothetical protein
LVASLRVCFAARHEKRRRRRGGGRCAEEEERAWGEDEDSTCGRAKQSKGVEKEKKKGKGECKHMRGRERERMKWAAPLLSMNAMQDDYMYTALRPRSAGEGKKYRVGLKWG